MKKEKNSIPHKPNKYEWEWGIHCPKCNKFLPPFKITTKEDFTTYLGTDTTLIKREIFWRCFDCNLKGEVIFKPYI